MVSVIINFLTHLLILETVKMTVYTSFDQLILHRIDSLDAGVRNILNLGAVLGSTFELIEVVEVFRQLHVESSATAQVKQTKEALRVAVKEGILDIFYFAGENRQSRLPRTPSQSAFDSGCNELPSRDLDPVECITYSFCHDIWRSTILKLMLSSRRRDVHRIIAETLEYRQHENTKNYFSKMKLFRHWRDSGVFEKTAELALSIGTRFEDLGLNTHRIRLAEEAMAMLGASDNPKKEANRGESNTCHNFCNFHQNMLNYLFLQFFPLKFFVLPLSTRCST